MSPTTATRRPRPQPGRHTYEPATTVPEPHAPAAPEGEWSPRRWIALSLLLVAGFMDLLDTTIVNVAIPSITADLHASYAAIQWIIAGYLLAFAVGLITFSRLGDIVGRRRVFLIGVIGFGAMSLSSGLAPNPGVLVASRVLQGTFAAAMVPQILSMIQTNFPRDEQRKAVALYGAIAGVAVMSGPLLAGVLLSELHLSWRSIFLINVPVSVALVIATIVVVPESKSADSKRLDIGGALLLSVALLGLVFGLIQGRALGWPPWVLGCMIGAVAVLAVFAVYERRLERRGQAPLIPLRLFAQRAFSAGLIVVLVFFSGIVGFFLAFTIFLQLGLGFTPLGSALTTFPSSVGLVLASLLSTKLAPRPNRRILAAGALLMAVGMAGLAETVAHFGNSLSPWDIRPVIFVFGVGMGLILPSLADVIIEHVRERDAGAASGVVNTGMQVGNAVGVAIIGVILFSVLTSHAATSAAAAVPQLRADLARAGAPVDAQRAVIAGFRTCFVDRSHEQDPAVTPASCRSPQLPAALQRGVARATSHAAVTARKDNFRTAIRAALWSNVGVFLITFLLLFALPLGRKGAHRRPRKRSAQHAYVSSAALIARHRPRTE